MRCETAAACRTSGPGAHAFLGSGLRSTLGSTALTLILLMIVAACGQENDISSPTAADVSTTTHATGANETTSSTAAVTTTEVGTTTSAPEPARVLPMTEAVLAGEVEVAFRAGEAASPNGFVVQTVELVVDNLGTFPITVMVPSGLVLTSDTEHHVPLVLRGGETVDILRASSEAATMFTYGVVPLAADSGFTYPVPDTGLMADGIDLLVQAVLEIAVAANDDPDPVSEQLAVWAVTDSITVSEVAIFTDGGRFGFAPITGSTGTRPDEEAVHRARSYLRSARLAHPDLFGPLLILLNPDASVFDNHDLRLALAARASSSRARAIWGLDIEVRIAGEVGADPGTLEVVDPNAMSESEARAVIQDWLASSDGQVWIMASFGATTASIAEIIAVDWGELGVPIGILSVESATEWRANNREWDATPVYYPGLLLDG